MALPQLSARAPKWLWVLVGVLFVGMATFGILYFKRPSIEAQTTKSHILPPEKLTFTMGSGDATGGLLTVSPNGRMLVFVAADSSGKTHIMVRALSALDAKELPETEGAYYPFWSPDNRYIGFFQSGKMRKIEASGGPPVTICNAPNGRGASWNQNDVIIFSPDFIGAIYRVAAAGGKATAVTTPDTSRRLVSHRWPCFLPDGKHFIYFSRTSLGGVEGKEDDCVVGSLDGKVRKRLMPAKGNALYASGYLIYLREKTLMAQPFDAGKLETCGDAIPIAEPIEFDLNYNRAAFSASQNGVLVYQASSGDVGIQLEWFDRRGESMGKVLEAAGLWTATLSPDGTKIALDEYDDQSRNWDIWLYDIARKVKSRFTFDPSVDRGAFWSPDGSRIVFTSNRRGSYDLFQKATSGAGAEELLLASPEPKSEPDWSSDGKFIAYSSFDAKTQDDLWILQLDGAQSGENRKPSVFLQTEFDELSPRFSPDMRWISYGSNESGRFELYVAPFIGGNGQPVMNQTRKWQVSASGALWSIWNRNGKELFYLTQGNKLMAADVKASGSTFDVGAVRQLFEVKSKRDVGLYDVTHDGQKFLIGIPVGGQSIPPLTLVTNWNAGLKNK